MLRTNELVKERRILYRLIDLGEDVALDWKDAAEVVCDLHEVALLRGCTEEEVIFDLGMDGEKGPQLLGLTLLPRPPSGSVDQQKVLVPVPLDDPLQVFRLKRNLQG